MDGDGPRWSVSTQLGPPRRARHDDRVGPPRPALEVADVIREHGDAFLAKYGGTLTAAQRQALRDLAALPHGRAGRARRALRRLRPRTHRLQLVPQPPLSQVPGPGPRRWLEREAELLLPVEYHHVVFTLPAEVAELALANPACCTTLLFQAAAATLARRGRQPEAAGRAARRPAGAAHLGAEPAPSSARARRRHRRRPVVRRSVVTSMRHRRWRSCRPGFFLPVRVLSRVFRGKFLDGSAQSPSRRASCASPGGWRAGRARRPSPRWLRPLYAQGLGGVRQAAVRRPGAGAQVPGPLHAPRGHQQSPAASSSTTAR